MPVVGECICRTARDPGEVQSCATNLSSSTFDALEKVERKDAAVRAMQRTLAAERMTACMALSGSTAASCRAMAKTLQQQISANEVTDSEVEDALLIYRADVTGAVFDPTLAACDSHNATSLDSCLSSANDRSVSAGGLLAEQKMLAELNALRKTAERWCTCRDTNLTEDTCMQQARSLYMELKGEPHKWMTEVEHEAKLLADAYCSGDQTKIVRPGTVDHFTEFHVGCSALDTRAVIAEIKRKISQVDPSFVVNFEKAVQPMTLGSDTRCTIEAVVELSASVMDPTEAALALAAITVTATAVAGGRRNTVTAQIFSAATTLECSSLGCFSESKTQQTLMIIIVVMVGLFLMAVCCCGVCGGVWLEHVKRLTKLKRPHEHEMEEMNSLVARSGAPGPEEQGLPSSRYAVHSLASQIEPSKNTPSDGQVDRKEPGTIQLPCCRFTNEQDLMDMETHLERQSPKTT